MPNKELFCRDCGQTWVWETKNWRCACGSALHLRFQSRFTRKRILENRPGFWRYRRALPIDDDRAIITLAEVLTPLSVLDIAGKNILIKNDQLLPSGSFKDRGAAVMLSHARELGVGQVVEDSSGNAGAAVAAYCARAGIRSRIYVPESTSPAKLVQILFHGAEVKKIPGSRDDAALAVQEAAAGIYYASHVWNPFFLHGIKTFAYELCEQMGWRAPDILFLPVGNGSLLLGAHLGLSELLEAGCIDRMPRLLAVQAAACAPLFREWKKNADPDFVPGSTLAEGIAVSRPPRAKEIIAAIEQTGGDILVVSEPEIEEALFAMGRKGYFIEPTSATVFAALERFIREKRPGETIATLITGHGLKAAAKLGILGLSP